MRKRLDLPFHGGGEDGSGRQLGFMSCASTENTLRFVCAVESRIRVAGVIYTYLSPCLSPCLLVYLSPFVYSPVCVWVCMCRICVLGVSDWRVFNRAAPASVSINLHASTYVLCLLRILGTPEIRT